MGRHLDVRVSLEREGGPALAPESVESADAAAVGPVVGLAHQPGRAGAAVEAHHVLAAGQGHGAVLAAEAGRARALVVGDQV